MLRGWKRILLLAVGLFSVGVVNCAADHIEWGNRYELSPLEHKRMRAKGLSDQEVFTVANIAHKTNLDPDWLINGIFRGVTLPQAGVRLGMTREELAQRNPEWTTPAWEEAVKRGDPFFHGPMPNGSMPKGSMPSGK